MSVFSNLDECEFPWQTAQEDIAFDEFVNSFEDFNLSDEQIIESWIAVGMPGVNINDIIGRD